MKGISRVRAPLSSRPCSLGSSGRVTGATGRDIQREAAARYGLRRATYSTIIQQRAEKATAMDCACALTRFSLGHYDLFRIESGHSCRLPSLSLGLL